MCQRMHMQVKDTCGWKPCVVKFKMEAFIPKKKPRSVYKSLSTIGVIQGTMLKFCDGESPCMKAFFF